MAGWLDEDELRIGLGCMRAEPAALAPTVAAALAAGITVFDTAGTTARHRALAAAVGAGFTAPGCDERRPS